MIIKELRNIKSKFNQCQNLPFIHIFERSHELESTLVRLITYNSKKIYTVGNSKNKLHFAQPIEESDTTSFAQYWKGILENKSLPWLLDRTEFNHLCHCSSKLWKRIRTWSSIFLLFFSRGWDLPTHFGILWPCGWKCRSLNQKDLKKRSFPRFNVWQIIRISSLYRDCRGGTCKSSNVHDRINTFPTSELCTGAFRIARSSPTRDRYRWESWKAFDTRHYWNATAPWINTMGSHNCINSSRSDINSEGIECKQATIIGWLK